MKKYLVFVLAVVLICALAAGCVQNGPSQSAAPTDQESEAPVVSGTVPAQEDIAFPEKEITIVVGSGEGGGLDLMSRSVAPVASEVLGQPIVVQCVKGGAGSVALTQIMQQPADGYTLYAISVDILLNDAFKKCEYTRNDLTPILRTQMDQSVFWVPKNSQFQTMQDIIDYAKANPGKLNFGMVGAAGIDEVIIRHFAATAGIEITCVPFDSGADSMAALVGAQVDIAHEEPGAAMAMYESGDIRPVLAFTEERLEAFPDTPTARELGYDITLGNWRGLFVKKGTPAEVVAKLQNAFKAALDSPDYIEYSHGVLLDLRPGYASSEDFSVFLEEQYVIYETVLKDLGYIK